MNEASTLGATGIAVAALFSEILGVDEVGGEDTFIDLGGSSLQAVELCDAVLQQFGIRLTIGDLANADTVTMLAALIDSRSGQRYRYGMPAGVMLNRGAAPCTAERQIVFALPGSGGSAWSFVPLAHQLPEDYVVYSIGQRGLEHRGLPHYRMNSLVARLVRQVREVQPHGPYVLLGHSMGGIAALEVAARLLDAGEQVDLVVLLDATMPTATSKRHGWEQRTASGAVSAGRQRSLWSRVGLYAQMYTVALARHEIGHRQELFYEIGLRLQNRHVVPTRRLPALAFVTEETEQHVEGWRVLLGDIDVERVGGDHMGIVRELSVVSAVAQRISEALARRK